MKVAAVCGTHHQPFARLVTAVDAWTAAGGGQAWIQYGHAAAPRHASGAPLVPRDELARHIAACDVVVCHGGPGAIWDALDARKPTVVVPRMRVHGEHVDDHQVAFARHLGRQRWVTVVEDIDELGSAIERAAREGAAPEIASQAAAAVARIAVHLDDLAIGRRVER